MHLIDLDEYRPGPFVSHDERLPGSTRYMAPEELVRGATIDHRTTVFHLGRTVAELLGDSRCTAARRAVVIAATQGRPDQRFQSVEEMVDAWRARGQVGLNRESKGTKLRGPIVNRADPGLRARLVR